MQILADKLKNELKQIEMKEAKGAEITWELEGERCTKYFNVADLKVETRSVLKKHQTTKN